MSEQQCTLLRCLVAGLAGLVFGLGLIISGMTQPAKVLGFLDITRAWDPSLAMVMLGAIAVALPGFVIAARWSVSKLGQPMQLPTARQIDRPLLLGAALFGIGWGMVGLCPGPALASLLTGGAPVWLFVFSMLAGMGLHTTLTRRGWL